VTDVVSIHGGGLDLLTAIITAATKVVPDLEARYEHDAVVLYTTGEEAEPKVQCKVIGQPEGQPVVLVGQPIPPVIPSDATGPAMKTCAAEHPEYGDPCARQAGHVGRHAYTTPLGRSVHWGEVEVAS
jgi:hypothetical protein